MNPRATTSTLPLLRLQQKSIKDSMGDLISRIVPTLNLRRNEKALLREWHSKITGLEFVPAIKPEQLFKDGP